MIAYVDFSVLIRVVLREPDPLPEWPLLDDAITSTLTRLEAARVLDRLRGLNAWTSRVSMRKEPRSTIS